MKVRGRHLVFGWTAVFLAVVAVIVLRVRAGFLLRHNVDALALKIQMLESTRSAVQDSVSILTSRTSLSARAEALGLKHPSDSTVYIIRLPGGH